MDRTDLFSQLLNELSKASPGLARLAQNEDALGRILKAYETQDIQAVRGILEDLRLTPYCTYICNWLCIWHYFRVCRFLCREIPDNPFEIPDVRRYAQSLAALAKDAEASKQLVESVSRQDENAFNVVVDKFELQPYCFLLCYWICHLHCQRVCRLICPPVEISVEIEPLEEFRQVAAAAGRLSEDEQLFETALKAVQVGDVDILKDIFTRFEFPCIFVCRWLCFIHCHRICVKFCPRIPRRFTVPDLRDLLLGWEKLATNTDVLEQLLESFVQEDEQTFSAILKEYGLQRYCFWLCHWICHIHCRLYCRLVCPPKLECQLDDPNGCVAEDILQQPTALVVAVRGTATGADFDHYTLEWSTNDTTYQASNFHYPPIPPGGGVQGNSPVTTGLLGYFETTSLDADDYFIRLTVFSKRGTSRVCKIHFSLFKQDVRILGISGFTGLDKPALDPSARFVENFMAKCSTVTTVQEQSFGQGISVQGSAFVGGCEEKNVKRYTLSYKEGHETNCASPGWAEFWKVEYSTVWQKRDMNQRQDTSTLTAHWVEDCIIPISVPPYCLLNVPEARLAPSSWSSQIAGGCERSGLYTFKLDVEDIGGKHYCDLQRLWLDNKPGHAKIQVGGVEPCADLNLTSVQDIADCTVPWPLPLVGIAYDEYIDEALPTSQRPNDNFDYFMIRVTKQGGPSVQIPIDAPDGACFFGTQRVGIPGNRCDSPGGTDITGLLAEFDLRALDPTCKASTSYASSIPASFALPRGECCVYTFQLWVYDTTKRSSGALVGHDLWPVKICNDLP